MKREEVLEMIIKVMETPTECRIIVDTKIPTLDKELNGNKFAIDTIYYMIDRSDDCGDTAADHWQVSCVLDESVVVKETMKVVDFIMMLCERVSNPNVWVESY